MAIEKYPMAARCDEILNCIWLLFHHSLTAKRSKRNFTKRNIRFKRMPQIKCDKRICVQFIYTCIPVFTVGWKWKKKNRNLKRPFEFIIIFLPTLQFLSFFFFLKNGSKCGFECRLNRHLRRMLREIEIVLRNIWNPNRISL